MLKSGLVLEGGGMRGLFTTGVLDVLIEEEIRVEGTIGVSAGACFGCNYKSRQVGRALRYNVLLRNDPKYMGFRSWLKTGDLVGAEYAYHVVPSSIDYFDKETFAANPMIFTVVCTDIETGEPVYKQIDEVNYDTLEWIRASASLPLVSKPVCLENHKLLDGGMSDAIPLKYWQSQGYEKNIVILTQPHDFRKTKTSLLPVFKLMMHKYPKIVEAMAHRHEMYNRELDYLSEQAALGNTLVIYPPEKLDIGRVEQSAEKMTAVHQLGVKTGYKYLDQIKKFLEID